MNKNVHIKIAGGPKNNNFRDAAVPPGVSAGEILDRLGLSEYVLTTGTDGAPFASDDIIYDKISDGMKLFAVSPADVAY